MKKVMIVDDSEFLRNRMRDVLEEFGLEVVAEATDGAEGVEIYPDVKPDFVVMDINMHNMDGRDALNMIINADPNAKVIMCSTLGQEKIIADCIKKGAQGYILKPYTPAAVHEVLNDIFPGLIAA